MINCLIIEDEPLAADVMQDYVKQISFLHLKGVCTDSIQALEVLRQDSIDLLFLDIHLPGLKGLDFLRTLKNPPNVILTTAYHEYALAGYELNVIDYLLKPIEFTRFIEAVNKVNAKGVPSGGGGTISIQHDKKTVIIPIDEILFIESQKEYVKIQTIQTSFTSKYAIKKMEEELNSKMFLRVHRSFIVAVSKIKAFNTQEIEVPGKVIPIGGNYKDTVTQTLHALFKHK